MFGKATLPNHRIERAGVQVIMTVAGDIYQTDHTANYAAIAAVAARLMTNLFKLIRFDDRDKLADGAS